MKKRSTLVLLVCVGMALVLTLVLLDRHSPAAAAVQAPLVESRIAASISAPLEEHVQKASSASATPIEVAPALERSSSIRIHLSTHDGHPFEEVFRESLSETFYWYPTVLVTAAAIGGALVSSIPDPAARALGTFTPRREHSDLPASCIGELELRAEPPLFLALVLFRRVLASKALPVFREDVAFVLDADEFLREQSGLKMRILDRLNAAPLGDVNVGLESGVADTVFTSSRSSKSDGSATFAPWASGPWTLRIAKEGYKELVRELVLPIGGILELGDLELETGVSVRVRVLGADPSEEISLSCTPLADLQSGHPRVGMQYEPALDSEGEYEVWLGDGTSVIRAVQTRAPYRMSPYTLVNRDQADTLVELELLESVSLKLHTSRFGQGQTIELRDDLNILEQAEHEITTSPIQFHFVPGRYHVRLGRPDGTHEERTIELGQSDLEVSLD